MSKFVTGDFIGVRLAWAAVALVTTGAFFWRDMRSLTWTGRVVLIAALAALGVVDSLLVPRLTEPRR